MRPIWIKLTRMANRESAVINAALIVMYYEFNTGTRIRFSPEREDFVAVVENPEQVEAAIAAATAELLRAAASHNRYKVTMGPGGRPRRAVSSPPVLSKPLRLLASQPRQPKGAYISSVALGRRTAVLRRANCRSARDAIRISP